MIELTEEQREQMSGSEPPRAIDPVTKTTYVLVREDVYQRLKAVYSEDPLFTTADMLNSVMADDDQHDPWLAELQKKYGGRG